jgi:phosphoribosylanthranilate isomerase
MNPKIKVCGITNLIDAKAACGAGAFAIGFVFAESQRKISVQTAKSLVSGIPKGILTVGVFVNESLDNLLRTVDEVGLTAVQLHGHEAPSLISELRESRPKLVIIKAIGLDAKGLSQAPQDFAQCDYILFDSKSDRTPNHARPMIEWEKLFTKSSPKPFFIAGGLRSDNISEMLTSLRPFGIDVSSGIESAPGKKSLAELERFFAKAQEAVKVGGESYV